MAKKPAKSDRQAVIEEIRRKQKGAERRRGFAILGVCLTIAVVIVLAAAYRPVKNWWDLRKFEDLQLAEIGAPASVCEDVITKKAEGNEQHVDQNVPVEYADAPPAFGSHWNVAGVAPVPGDRKFYTRGDRPPVEALVHNFEHGYTILWYDETAAEDGEMMSVIEGLAAKFSGDPDNLRSQFIAAPWTSEDGGDFPEGMNVAFTHWAGRVAGEEEAAEPVGVWQYCSEPSGEALEKFMLDYPYMNSPEGGM